MGTPLNFGEWVRRLGWARTDEPPIPYEASPVLLVGDHKTLTPKFEGPGIVLGANSPGAAAELSVMEWHSNSPGGMQVVLRLTAALGVVWGVVDDATAFDTLGPVEMDRDMIMTPGARARGFTGTVLPANQQLTPPAIYPYQVAFPLEIEPPGIFIPNGRKLLVEGLSMANAISGWAMMVEYPAN